MQDSWRGTEVQERGRWPERATREEMEMERMAKTRKSGEERRGEEEEESAKV